MIQTTLAETKPDPIVVFIADHPLFSDSTFRDSSGVGLRCRLLQLVLARVDHEAASPRILDSLDANFLESCMEQQPDILLTEMQDQLREICGVM
ncbi:hypothetical protein AZE42_11356 [Rhizopogon vesiculosus]|uniref:Uncharacterized protein n=1 Tax=Rhizopogon vesiculosus TaxID=180088 RepID=A0A1J8RFU5_9AGAM|nr:hypothetical protein AZE42_11356 [Rhizopogon vesiculosus]